MLSLKTSCIVRTLLCSGSLYRRVAEDCGFDLIKAYSSDTLLRCVGLFLKISSPDFMHLYLCSSRQQSEEAAALKKGKEMAPEMLEKIIQGKVNKRMADICLLNQVHILSYPFISLLFMHTITPTLTYPLFPP